MLIWLAERLIHFCSLFNVVFYLTFRAILSLITTLLLSLWMGPHLINYLNKLQIKQTVRIDGPKSHLKKNNIPTMGGLMIVVSATISIVVWTHLCNPYIWYILFILTTYSIVGLVDDYIKVTRKNTNGLNARWKYLWLSIIALILTLVMFSAGKNTTTTQLIVPFFKGIKPQLEFGYILLSYLVLVGTSNAVNLTDGLDGLAAMPVVFITAGLASVAWATSNMNFAEYLDIPYIHLSGELVVVCTTIIGAVLGFLWFNAYPAQVFMGDVGSLALGGVLGTIAILLRQELLLLIMGGVFVLEALSVIVQVGSFKLRGHRVFLMAPIHHHYELLGWLEPHIIVRFWIVSLIFVFIGLATLKVRLL